jgi:hypothetical protein
MIRLNIHFALTTLAFFLTLVTYSQSRITGRVLNEKGEAVPLANILIVDSYDGTTSDAGGNFDFTTTETGERTLIVKSVGYQPFESALNLDNTSHSLAITLQEKINQLEAVTISAGAFTASDQSRRTVLRAVDIATTAGATADIAGALNTLPGTQKVGESGRLFVRGGDGNEARTFIDGLLVMSPYGPAAPNTPSRGRFLPFMFKGTSFSTGGYSSEYGQALSSALVLDSKDESEISRTDVGLLSVGGDIAHTEAWRGGSAAGKIQYTDIRPYFNLIDQRVDWKTPPTSVEASAALRQKIGNGGIIKFFGNLNHSALSLYNHDIDNHDLKQLYDLTNNYRYVNGAYKNPLSDRWLLRGGMSYTAVNNQTSSGDNVVDENESGLHAKGVIEGSLNEHVEIRSGVELLTHNFHRAYNQGPGTSTAENIASAFSESDVYLNNNFVTRAGVRMEFNDRENKLRLDPRISLAYRTGTQGQLSFAFGAFRQSPEMKYLIANRDLTAEKAMHYILNYQRIDNRKTFRVEAFYKTYDDLVKYTDTNFLHVSNSGHGFARGIEFFWRDSESVKHLDYWLSYSLLDTERDYLDFPSPATPAFASRHNLSAVCKFFVTDIRSQLGMTWSVASGRPFRDPNTEKFHASRTPDYHDLSFNWSYLPKPSLIVYFSCTNVLGRDNIFGYEYSTTPDAEGFFNRRPVRQPARRFLFIGIFLTLSKEKSVNQLPSL